VSARPVDNLLPEGSRSSPHLLILARTKSDILALRAMRLPPRACDHKMHFGNIKISDQHDICLLKTASARSLPQIEAKAERWLLGIRLISGCQACKGPLMGRRRAWPSPQAAEALAQRRNPLGQRRIGRGRARSITSPSSGAPPLPTFLGNRFIVRAVVDL